MLLNKRKVGIVTKIGAVIVSLAFVAVYIPVLGDVFSGSNAAQPQQVQQAGQAIAALEQAVQKDPKQSGTWVQLGNAYYEVSQWDKAANAYSKAIELDPKNVSARVDMSIAYFGMGQIDTATAEAVEATKINPSFAPAYFNLGVFLSAQGKNAEAVEAYEAYLKLEPNGDKAKDAKDRIGVLKKELAKSGGSSGTPTTVAPAGK